MDITPSQKANQVKENYKQSQVDIINLYLTEIKDRSFNIENNERSLVINKLELIIEELGDVQDAPVNSESNSVFDSNKARDIRLKESLSQKELARQLGIKQAVISHYETGKVAATHLTKRNSLTGRYFTWLKEHGYEELILEEFKGPRSNQGPHKIT